MLVPTLKLNQYVYMLLALHNSICLHPLTYKCKISLLKHSITPMRHLLVYPKQAGRRVRGNPLHEPAHLRGLETVHHTDRDVPGRRQLMRYRLRVSYPT